MGHLQQRHGKRRVVPQFNVPEAVTSGADGEENAVPFGTLCWISPKK